MLIFKFFKFFLNIKKINILLFKNKLKFFKILYKNMICLNCHNKNFKYKIKTPFLLNQNTKYIKNSILSYKFIIRKSILMNLIANEFYKR